MHSLSRYWITFFFGVIIITFNQRNSDNFLFCGTAGIPPEQTNCSVCFVFRSIFLSEIANPTSRDLVSPNKTCTRTSEALKCQLKMRETKGFYILEHLWTGPFLFINLAAPFLSFLSALRMDPKALVLLFIGKNIYSALATYRGKTLRYRGSHHSSTGIQYVSVM
jgi:hypothetical protein